MSDESPEDLSKLPKKELVELVIDLRSRLDVFSDDPGYQWHQLRDGTVTFDPFEAARLDLDRERLFDSTAMTERLLRIIETSVGIGKDGNED